MSMTGIIICDNCGILFIGNGSLERIKTKTPLVHVLLASKLKTFKGIRNIISTWKNKKTVVPEFMDFCKRCTKK